MAKQQSEASAPDAIEMLKEDHKRVQKLFKDFEKVDRDDAEAVQDLVETACMELQLHAMLEEEIFYPAVRDRLDGEKHQDLLNEAEVEHESAEDLISKIQELEPGDEMYAAYFKVLAEYVKHHIKEEEKTLFPDVQKQSGLDLDQLAQEMRERREELFAEIESGDTEDVEASAAPDEEGDDEVLATEDEEELSEDEQESWPSRRH